MKVRSSVKPICEKCKVIKRKGRIRVICDLGDFVADGIYIQRKNIEKVQHKATEGMEAYIDWECDSREITVSEYQMLESIKQINTDKAIDDYTAQLIEEGLL